MPKADNMALFTEHWNDRLLIFLMHGHLCTCQYEPFSPAPMLMMLTQGILIEKGFYLSESHADTPCH